MLVLTMTLLLKASLRDLELTASRKSGKSRLRQRLMAFCESRKKALRGYATQRFVPAGGGYVRACAYSNSGKTAQSHNPPVRLCFVSHGS